MQRLAAELIDNAETIAKETINEWNELADHEPWHRLPATLDMDHLPALIRNLARTALATFFAEPERTQLARDSVRHGEHRFGNGVSEEVLSREYELLRWSLWHRLRDTAPPDEAAQAIIRLDSAIGFAHGATLRGYHRRVIEETGDWPGALDRYIRGWSFPAP